MLPFFAALLLTGCAKLPMLDSSTLGANRVALVIGNGAYEGLQPLPNALNDADDMCRELRRLKFDSLCARNVRDRAEFDALVQRYLDKLTPQSVGVVFYAGHGVQASNANYLIPIGVGAQTLRNDPLKLLYGADELFERLRGRGPRFQLVILDACRSDLFAALGRRAPTRSALLRALETTARAGTGLAPLRDAPENTLVLYATAANDAAYDGEGRNGPLTQHVLTHIGTRGLLVEDVIKRVMADVRASTVRQFGKAQTPYVYGSFSGRFCFAGCPGETLLPGMN
jgi:uncharacterized caspase-like protein